MLTKPMPIASAAARVPRPWRAGALLIGFWLAATPTGVARAQDALVGDCFRSHFGNITCALRWGNQGDPYLRRVPGPRDAREEEEFAKHDRNWDARCRPTTRQDEFGVSRYRYSAAGCEFGLEN
jgi:hypothetical protein